MVLYVCDDANSYIQLVSSYNFQYQMHKNNNIIDAVSANQLLKALNTLHSINQTQSKMNNHKSINLNHHSFSLEQYQPHNQQIQKQPSNVINFDQYMQKKNNNNKQVKAHHHTRKSISPLKDINQTLDNLNNMKSRSHSPLFKKVDKSIIKKQKPVVDTKVLRQIKKQNIIKTNDISYQASFQSKKILDQKQRKGIVYVPIQFRTQQLMKQKQMKIAKLQKEKEITQILKEKQYTFKPTLIKNKKIKADSKYLQNIQNKSLAQGNKRNKEEQSECKSNQLTEEEKNFKDIECYTQTQRQDRYTKVNDAQKIDPIHQETIRYDSKCQENEFLTTQPIQLKHQHQSTEYLFPNYKGEQLKPKKYKNEKFNFLLDLIH